MTKILQNHNWTKPALDSAKFRIQANYAIDTGSILGKGTRQYIDETGELRNPKEKTPSVEVEHNGHRSTISLITDNRDRTLYYTGAINAKHLGTKLYPYGLQPNNIIQTIHDLLWKAGEIRISDNGYQNILISDRDVKIDAEINNKQWHEAIDEIKELTEERYKKDLSVFHKDKTNKARHTGYQYKDRGKGTALRMNIKGYDKATDILCRKKYDTSIPGYTGEGIKRIEANIETALIKHNPILQNVQGDMNTATGFMEVMRSENDLINDYIWNTLQAYQITTERKQIQRNMSQEGPNEFIKREMAQITAIEKQALTLEELYQEIAKRADKAFIKQKAYKIRKLLAEDYAIMKPKDDPNQLKFGI